MARGSVVKGIIHLQILIKFQEYSLTIFENPPSISKLREI